MCQLFVFSNHKKNEKIRIVAGIGVFDGVHLGHRRIIAEAVALAADLDAVPVALTFEPHPRAVLRPGEPPMLLIPLAERLRQLKLAGAAEVGVARFDAEFARLEPEEFLDRLLGHPDFELAGICVGRNWHFGFQGKGNGKLLESYCKTRNLMFHAVSELELDGKTVSSSAIRRAIASGKLETANRMLGRRYRLFGQVEPGYQAAGKLLSCPTANITLQNGVLPPDGVYAANFLRGDAEYPAIVNIGFSPTFGWKTERRRVEAHLLDFTGNLYGEAIALEPLGYLREERVFENPEALKKQIVSDVAKVKESFKNQTFGGGGNGK